MAYRIHSNNIVTKITDVQKDIELVKKTITLKEINNTVLLGNWIRVIDLIRDIKDLYHVIITANEIKALSNVCSLTISHCGSFIRNSNNEELNSITCLQAEKDSIWFSKLPYRPKLPLLLKTESVLEYIEVMSVISDEFNNELLGKDLHQNVIPIISVDKSYFIPTIME